MMEDDAHTVHTLEERPESAPLPGDVRASLLIEGAHTHTGPAERTIQPAPALVPKKLDLGFSMPEFNRLLRDERTKRAVRRALDLEERPPTPMPPAISLKERFLRPRPPISYRIEEWFVVGGHIVLVAQYKSGKTTLVGNLVRSLVDGDDFLGVAIVNPVESVVILDFEMSEGQIERWLRDQNIRNTDRVHLVSLRGAAGSFDVLSPDRRREWAQKLRELRAQFVVLDCLRPALDAIGLDEHTQAGRWFTGFDQLLKEADVPETAVVHHSGHGGDRSRGDSRILDWPDGIWNLVRADRDDLNSPRFISAKGRDISVEEGHLEFDPISRHLAYSARSRKSLGADRVMLDVLREIAKGNTPMSIRAIAAAVKPKGHSTGKVEAALVAAVGEEYLTRIEHKTSHLHGITAKGRAFLAGETPDPIH